MQHYNEEKVRAAVAALIEAIGENPEREGLADTPKRVARAWREWTDGTREFPHEFRTFPTSYGGLVVRKQIPFASTCEHHLAHYGGTVDFGYVPNGRAAGLSKITRYVRHYTARLGTQEELTEGLAREFEKLLSPQGLIVHVSALHTCESSRGARVTGVPTITAKATGSLASDGALAAAFYRMIA